MTEISVLPSETIRLMSSSQIITSASSVVKELVENSLDAGASTIHVVLENYGLDLIEVKDDGPGLTYENVHKMFLPGYTSKIKNFHDLATLCSYGFRGEALSAICKLGETTLTTKTEKDEIAMTYPIDSHGVPRGSKPSHGLKGTTISVKNLFSCLPVRKQFMSSKKKMSEELKKIEQTLQSVSLIHLKLRVTLRHNKCNIWQKNAVCNLKQALMQIVGARVVSKMEVKEDSKDNIIIQLVIPKKGVSDTSGLFSSSTAFSYVFINKRPVALKEISKVIEEQVLFHFKNIDDHAKKHPVFIASVEVAPHEVDVNLEPNKTKVLLKNLDTVLKNLQVMLENYYEQSLTSPLLLSPHDVSIEEDSFIAKRQKMDDSLLSENLDQSACDNGTNWTLDIIHDKPRNPTHPKPAPVAMPVADSICSRINQENCILTSADERSFLLNNNVLSGSQQIALCKPIVSNDIQRNLAAEETPRRELIIPEWPSRNLTKPGNQRVSNEWQETSLLSLPNESSSSKTMENLSTAYDASTLVDTSINDRPVETMSAADWSRGAVTKENGDILKGGATVMDPMVADDICKFDLSLQSVSSQMGKKELTGFTKFARIMRSKIIAENPGMLFTEVSSVLAERWRGLSLDEKDYYENIAKAVDEKRKVHNQSKVKKPEIRQQKDYIPKFLEIMKSKMKIKRPERKKISYNISMEIIERLRQKQETSCDPIGLIGQCEPNGDWLYINEKEIGHIRHMGLQELVIYNKMLSNHKITCRKLQPSEPITELDIGKSEWNTLLSLESEYDEELCRHVIISEAISKNGFRIELVKGSQGEVLDVYLTAVAEEIDNYGVLELKEILESYKSYGEFAGLSNWRPNAAKQYMMGKAKEIVKRSNNPPGYEDMNNLLGRLVLLLRTEKKPTSALPTSYCSQ